MGKSLLGRASAALVTTLLAVACGGGSKPAGPAVNIPAAGASASGSAASGATTSAPPPGLPPMATMPPPGVSGSKKAKKKADTSLAACGGGGSPRSSKDPAAEVKRLGDACAAASKMRAVGGPIRGSQADKDAHQEHKVRVEAGKCYRVYFAYDEGVTDAVVVLRDSAGDLVGESPAAALPDDGAMCFTAADEITLMVAVGAGKGAYAAQVWSD